MDWRSWLAVASCGATPTILKDFPTVELFIQREELNAVENAHVLPPVYSAAAI